MKSFLIFLLTLSFSYSYSQALPPLKDIPLNVKADYQPADSIVLLASTYILSNPFDENDARRLECLQFILRWMTGTPDFNFTFDKVATKISKGNDNLMGLYIACMSKFSLENRALSKDAKAVELNSLKMLLEYCQNPNNNIQMTKQLKKLAEANQKGELEKEL